MEITDNINNFLQKFDLVLLIMNGSDTAKNLTENFLNSEALKQATRKVLVLSNQNLLYANTRNQYYQLNTKELDAIRKLYFMYDFSDHFRVLSDNPQYGSLLNYVNTGNMTLEDAFQMLLM